MTKQFNPAENDLPQVPPAEATEASGNNDTLEYLNGETTRDGEREEHTFSGSDQIPAAPARRRRAHGTRAAHGEQPAATSDGILHLPVRNEAQPVAQGDESDEATTVAELEAQGFTTDEAIRLAHVLANLSESRESQATLRRLRFTRWLIERGVLDEFSA